jgi:sugar O-acyltransferase (sialic acid O-acetyltransferase NeuD family)
MKNKLTIFGNGQQAELAYFYFKNDSNYTVESFCIDGSYIKESTFNQLPVIPSEEITKYAPASDFNLFISLGYTDINKLRKEKFELYNKTDYNLVSYIHSSCINYSSKIGKNCFILENTTLQPCTIIDDNTCIFTTSHIGHHTRVGKHCYIAGGIISGNVSIDDETFIGAQCVVRDNITIGKKCILGMGSVVMNNVPDYGIVPSCKSEISKLTTLRIKKI